MRKVDIPFTACLVCGTVSTMLGATVLVGWFTHNLALLHIRPSWVAMAFNTALGFMLGGISMVALVANHRRVAVLGAAFGLIIGSLTLIEYILGLNTHVDELFFHAYTRAGITNPARMAFCSALGFVLVGGVCFSAQWQTDRITYRWRVMFTAIAGALVASLGVIGLSGYFLDISSAYSWGQLTRMAVHTATGFIILGLGLVAFAFFENQRRERCEPLDLIPPLIGICTATASICLWQDLIVANRAEIFLVSNGNLANSHSRLTALGQIQSLVMTGALVSGLFLAMLLSVAVALGRSAKNRSEKLAREIAERKQAQTALQAAQAELEERVTLRTIELAESNRDLEAAHQVIEDASNKQRAFLRDVLASVTEGRLCLCAGDEDLPKPLVRFDGLVQLTRDDISTLRSLTRDAAITAGLSDEQTMDLITSVGEAAMNAVVHGGGGRGWIYVQPSEAVHVWVTDEGGGIEMSSIHQATLRRGFTTADSFGHGFWMMLNTVDTLWLLTGPSGTTVVMEQCKIAKDRFLTQLLE